MLSETDYSSGNPTQMVVITPQAIQYLDKVGWCKSYKYKSFSCAICKSQYNNLMKMSESDRQQFLTKNNLTMEIFDYASHPTMINVDGQIQCVCPSLNNKLMHFNGKGRIGCSHCKNSPMPHTWAYCPHNPNKKELSVDWSLIA